VSEQGGEHLFPLTLTCLPSFGDGNDRPARAEISRDLVSHGGKVDGPANHRPGESTMSFPRYPAYKPSGVEWLGEVPEHWNLVQIKRILQSIEQGWSPQCEAAPAEPGEWGILKVGCVNGGKFNPNDNKALPRELQPDERLAIRNGDVLVSRANTRELVGSVAMAGRDYPSILLCDKLYRLRTNQATCCPAFLARYLVSDGARNVIETSASGASNSMLNIGQSVIVNMPIALPSAREQADVIDFLDRETAKIDALIAEQQRLIELLQEKRQAVISHAVTKGLNPDATMKDSGVEWLGEVPEHWEVTPIKHLCDIYSGFPFKSDLFQGDGIPVVRMSNISGGCIDLKDAAYVPEHEVPAEAFIRTGDLLLGLSGSVGNFGIAKEEDLPAAVNQRVALIRTSNPILKHFLGSSLFSDQVTCGLPSTTIANVSASQLGNCLLAVPPSDEQEQIEAFLLDFVSGSAELMTSIESSLSLLQERRSALISAAVTGQIDVRGLVPEASAA
jgi:type I restriction enzyme S subunit